jgi:phosphoserine phosphatase
VPERPQNSPEDILVEFRETRAAILARHPRARLLVFWDLDGTILCGDCSEGLQSGGRTVYPGLVQVGIELGLSASYAGPHAHLRCMSDYAWLKGRIGSWLAYPFLAQVFAGAGEEVLLGMARDHFQGVLRRFYYPGARRILDEFAGHGVEQHVLSASAEVFVRGASDSLGIPAHRLHGIRLRSPGGRVSRELVYPVTYAEGKVARLRQIVRAAQSETLDRPVFVVGGFGDSLDNDGPYLAHVARGELPSGRPIAALVNEAPVPGPLGDLLRPLRLSLDLGKA